MNNLQAPGFAVQGATAVPTEDEALSRGVLFGLAIVILLALFAAYESLENWGKNVERQHHRGQLLAAYRRRRQWKKSDIANLQSLGVNRAAQHRMERLEGRGRPVVKPLQPLDVEIVDKLRAFQVLTDPYATPAERRKAFRHWPWWPHYVEALYRGEHGLAKRQGLKSPSIEAEINVGHALGISAAKVHSICGDIRRLRKGDPEAANFPAFTLDEYESWMASADGFAQSRLGEEASPSPVGLTKRL